ncbi:MAG: hypothetical protein A2900_00305 [Candidatus Chisholmbacteria bacterium RIFCSPLOWO2_01_FULL_50_28]|uniref:Thioredoxin domain-containing protein n=1 Tax=Candidatus Chisholmbacteria bacterium RIFCSPHIGHO2_01_FULL_52_32 TaxID=1797591 RepID=A0A1G1VQZ1_9BACT|nr:MAG: hypothetical protein A2786_00650 [Candidatus Chisholmbacteria bacterium RIFCSPHIGHO2_01_FULL_52_32]OGY19546.1 MAG: hypothetical protein A2900_00305 [Candidatus Chisholmbacteria bacterium RIFCSPLOWO2_01_FULL_50_28]
MNSQLKIIGLGLFLSVAIVFGAASLLSKMEQRAVDPSLIVGDARLSTGSAEPRVTIVEFSDFQCPACRASESVIQEVLRENSNDVRFVYRHFPLTSIHDHALDAAKASEIAFSIGKFWEMHDLLFELQDEWATSNDIKALFASYADRLGMDPGAFLNLWDASEYEQQIRDDIRDGRTLGISSTPTIFMNGRKVSADQLSQAVTAELH